MKREPPGAQELLFGGASIEDSALEALRQRLTQEMENKRKLLILHTTIGMLAGMGLMVLGCFFILLASEVRITIMGFAVLMIGLETTVLIRLWYWVVDSRNVMMREVKQVQQQLAELAASVAPASVHGEDKDTCGQ